MPPRFVISSPIEFDDRITMVPPQPHHVLSTYYRAADVTIVLSRSESFELVAPTRSACTGTSLLTCGLRMVDHGRTGLGYRGDPDDFAERSSASSAIRSSPGYCLSGLPRCDRCTGLDGERLRRCMPT